jgi:hypothetical protein
MMINYKKDIFFKICRHDFAFVLVLGKTRAISTLPVHHTWISAISARFHPRVLLRLD